MYKESQQYLALIRFPSLWGLRYRLLLTGVMSDQALHFACFSQAFMFCLHYRGSTGFYWVLAAMYWALGTLNPAKPETRHQGKAEDGFIGVPEL